MKSNVLFIAILLISASAMAQSGLSLQWETEFSNEAGANIMELYAVTATSGGTAAAGESSTKDGVAMYVAKYQANGQLQWDTALVAANSSSLGHILSDNQGNVYVAGSEITGTFNQRQIHLAKLNANGQIQWHTTYRGPGNLYAGLNDIKLSGNKLYLCGVDNGNASFNAGWVASFDLNGNLIWENTFYPGGDVSLSKLVVDNAGNMTVVGYADFGYSFLALRYSNAGTLKWQYPDTLDGSSEKYLSDVVIGNNGNGNVYAIGTEETGAFFEFDIVTLKLDTTGNLIWKKSFNNGGENEGRAIRIGTGGNIYSFGNKEDSFDFFAHIIAYDPAGNKLWEADHQIDSDTKIVDVDIAGNGDIFLGVQDFDSLGFARFSGSGNLLAKKNYGTDQADYLADISFGSNTLFGVGYAADASSATIFSLTDNNLSENFLAEPIGMPLSDARPGALTSDASHLWLSTFSDDGDSALFSIIQTDLAGNFLWEKESKYRTIIPSFPFLQHDGSGNVVGLFQNSLSTSSGQCGLVKYDVSGNELFTVLLDSANVYNAGGLALDGTGNIYLTAYNTATKRMLLSRYNASGLLEWTKDYQSPSTTFPYSLPFQMKYTPQGKIVIVSSHKGASNDNDLHLFQYSANGTLDWHKDVANQSGNLTDFAGMEVALNGDITVFGSSGIGNYVAAKFDDSGNLIWDEQGLSGSTGAPRSMAVDNTGRTYLCFSTNSHVYIRQLNSAGALIADKQLSIPSSGSFFFPWKCAWVSSHLVILGEHLMPSGGFPFEMLVDAQLDPVYAHIDSSARGKIQAMTVDPAGNPYGAYVTGDLSLGSGYRGSLVRKFSISTLGIDALLVHGTFSLFPNPAVDQLNVKLDLLRPGFFDFSLFDLQGRKVVSFGRSSLQTGMNTVPLSIPAQLGSGTYLLGVVSDEGIAFRKLMILR